MTFEQTEVYAGVYLGGPPREQRASLENPNLPLNDPAIWEEIFGASISTDSGILVNEHRALMYAPLWQAVNLIASTVATLPFHHFRRLPEISDSASERVESTQDYLVSVSPSGGVEPDDYCTAVQFWESFMVDVLLWGNGFAYIVYDGAGRPMQLRLLNPDRTNAEMIKGALWYVTEYNDERDSPKLKSLFPWEVLHVKGFCPYGHQAPRFIQYARNSIALALAQQRFASKFFLHGGRKGGILELPIGMSKVARDNVEEGFRKSYEGSDNPFKTVILRDSAKFHEAQTSPDDAQLVEGTEEQVRMIARWFGLSPAMLGVTGSVSYNSKEQDNQAFFDQCLKRWLRKIEAECGIKLLAASKQVREFFRYDVTDLISLDAQKQAAADQIYIQMRVKNPNEVRAKLGLLPYDGGDKFENPATSSPMAKPEEDKPVKDMPTEMPPEKMPVNGNGKRDWRQSRILFNLTHVARQKARNHRSFMEWLDGGFKPQREEWTSIAGGEPEPPLFVEVANAFGDAVQTSTADQLPSRIDQIALTFEKGS